ncbi:photosystem II stability/assembly factor-like uncharacterized protein [Jejuia pallidilutea]|uniref:Photosystem II stability/assembly factor-like uncharacterized protein n=1 Tax=Jejuia pallidilutea TaxID=504487 RepID=A0A362WYF5_9FLAO|nr:oxidoreductase [Jejuia pallidilutea]PQV47314.1 photosystem II stability/assembly factor-like uncharacterized protein [Jejuia pallidilutea]
MRYLSLFISIVLTVVSCEKKEKFKPRSVSKIEFRTLLQDSLLDVRALEIVNENCVFFLTSNGYGGSVNLSEDNGAHVVYPIFIDDDSLKNNFRALAYTRKNRFGLTIGTPAKLYKIKNGENTMVYQEHHPKVFYDAMAFWNDQEGIAIGDPTDNCMSIIITRDGGETWTKLSCDDIPNTKAGEAAFAASDTNIAIIGTHTWVATGGVASRILYSPDKGHTWQVFDTPIIQGKETTGIYSIDFYDELNGFAIGGDYTKPDENSANKIRTKDGGKTWELVANNKNPGYRSCVQYIPNSNAKALVAIGFSGIDYSNDFGSTWKHLSDEGFYTIRFLNDSVAYAVGKGSVSKLTFK